MILVRCLKAQANFRTNVRRFRTRARNKKGVNISQLLLLWSLSNAVLASIILSGGGAAVTFSEGGNGNRTAIYMLVILSKILVLRPVKSRDLPAPVFVAGMSLFKFICATLYLIMRLFGA